MQSDVKRNASRLRKRWYILINYLSVCLKKCFPQDVRYNLQDWFFEHTLEDVKK